jgi:hypothetical protein
VRGEPTVPNPRRLLQPVQRLVEEGDVIGLCRINKSNRLATIDSLQEDVV